MSQSPQHTTVNSPRTVKNKPYTLAFCRYVGDFFSFLHSFPLAAPRLPADKCGRLVIFSLLKTPVRPHIAGVREFFYFFLILYKFLLTNKTYGLQIEYKVNYGR
jgi:hypothetical protein